MLTKKTRENKMSDWVKGEKMWKSLPTSASGDFIPYHSQILIKFMDGKIPSCFFFRWKFIFIKNLRWKVIFWDEKVESFALLSRFNAISSRAVNQNVFGKRMWEYVR